MPTTDSLLAYEAFRQQLRVNPPLVDAWGGADGNAVSGNAGAGGPETGGVLTILERPGVGASNVAFHVIQGLGNRGIPQHTLGYGDPGSIRQLASYHAFDAAIAVPDPEESWAALRELTDRVIEECAPRAVVTHREFPWAWIVAEIQVRRPGLCTIVSCNGGPFLFRVMDTRLEAEMAGVLARASLVTALSRFIRSHLLQRYSLDPTSVVPIRGGYDPEIFHANGRVEDGGPIRATYVGRLEEDKAPDRFIETVRLASEAGVSIRATVVGDGAMRSALERSAQEGTPEGTVRFTGSVDAHGVATLLRRSDVLVVPSRTEGLGIQTVEALACGVAVIASRVGGLQELLTESRAGRLADSTEEMAALLKDLAENPAARRNLAENGPAYLRRERMDWERVSSRWNRELDRLSPCGPLA